MASTSNSWSPAPRPRTSGLSETGNGVFAQCSPSSRCPSTGPRMLLSARPRHLLRGGDSIWSPKPSTIEPHTEHRQAKSVRTRGEIRLRTRRAATSIFAGGTRSPYQKRPGETVLSGYPSFAGMAGSGHRRRSPLFQASAPHRTTPTTPPPSSTASTSS